jgi:hypothetical protein
MTDPTLACVRVRCSAGHQHRRYPRWSEVDPSVRLPEGQWLWRWRLDQRCAVAVSIPQEGLFQPCGGRPSGAGDLCERHARSERRVCAIRGGQMCEAPLPAPGAGVVTTGGSE